MPQAAYDTQNPNGSARRPPGDRVIALFRLYRRLNAVRLDAPGGTTNESVLGQAIGTVRGGIQWARNGVADVAGILAPTSGPLAGRVLEKEFQFVLILEGIEQATDLRTSFSYVRDGYFIDTPLSNGRGVTRFALRGRTFWNPVLVNGVPVDGDSALKDFQELIDDYFFPGSRKGYVTSDYALYWVNLNAPVSAEDPFGEFEWLIHPIGRGLRISQTAQRPFQRFFQFEFLGLESNRDRAKAEDGFLAGMFSRGFLSRILDGLGLGDIKDAVDGVFGIVSDTTALFTDIANVVTTVNDYLIGVTQFIKASFAQVRGLFDSVQTIIGRVQDGINLLRGIPDLVSEQWRLLKQNFPGLVSGPENGIQALGACYRLRDALLALMAQPHVFDPTLAALSGGALGNSSAVVIPPEATLEQLAQQQQVDVATLIAANSLRYPFVAPTERPERQLAAAEATRQAASDLYARLDQALLDAQAAGQPAADLDYLTRERDRAAAQIARAEQAITDALPLGPAQPGVLYAGDPIAIPATRASAAPSIRPLDPRTEATVALVTSRPVDDEDRIFGFDLALDDAGNLVWDHDRNDLALERGLDHMARVQTRYVKLPLGALRFAPGLGNFAWEDLARWQTPATTQLLANAMYQTLRQDPRVKAVTNVTATTAAGVAQLVHDVTLVNDRTLTAIPVPVS